MANLVVGQFSAFFFAFCIKRKRRQLNLITILLRKSWDCSKSLAHVIHLYSTHSHTPINVSLYCFVLWLLSEFKAFNIITKMECVWFFILSISFYWHENFFLKNLHHFKHFCAKFKWKIFHQQRKTMPKKRQTTSIACMTKRDGYYLKNLQSSNDDTFIFIFISI